MAMMIRIITTMADIPKILSGEVYKYVRNSIYALWDIVKCAEI